MATSIPPTTKREDAVPTRVFSVRDLVLGKDAVASAVDLGEILRQATDAAYWEEPGRSLVVEGSGVLGVTADPEMQRRVASLLADVRRSPPARR
jgi:hypothetical protein